MNATPLETIEIRTSAAEIIVPLVLSGFLLAGLAASSNYMAPRQRLITFVVFAALAIAGFVPRLLNRGPRLVISPEHLAWRESRGASLRQVAWSDIRSARIEPIRRRTPPQLRLVLASASALEVVGSGEQHRHVDIPIDAIDVSWDSLARLIHRRAPHLFAEASRGA